MTQLAKLKNYIARQYKDIETWEDANPATKEARIDELQCLETYLDYLIAEEAGTLEQHYAKLFGENE